MNIEHVEVAWRRIKGKAKQVWDEVAPRNFKRPDSADSSKLVDAVQEKGDLRS
jgi:hypothetical protein